MVYHGVKYNPDTVSLISSHAVTLMQFLGIICFQEELNVVLFHIKDVSSRQREVQKKIELLQSENTKDLISVPHR